MPERRVSSLAYPPRRSTGERVSRVAYSLVVTRVGDHGRGHGGVAAPGSSGLGGDSGGGVVVVAQRLGDDGCWDLEDELAQGGGPAGQGGDAEIPDKLAEVAGVQRLASRSLSWRSC